MPFSRFFTKRGTYQQKKLGITELRSRLSCPITIYLLLFILPSLKHQVLENLADSESSNDFVRSIACVYGLQVPGLQHHQKCFFGPNSKTEPELRIYLETLSSL